jgi:hypothetical protein
LTHLVVQTREAHIVPFAAAAVVVHAPTRHDEQADAAHAGRRTDDFREH